MPDFDMILRDLHERLAPNEQARREIRAYYHGMDAARKEIAILVAVIAGVALLITIGVNLP